MNFIRKHRNFIIALVTNSFLLGSVWFLRQIDFTYVTSCESDFKITIACDRFVQFFNPNMLWSLYGTGVVATILWLFIFRGLLESENKKIQKIGWITGLLPGFLCIGLVTYFVFGYNNGWF